MIGKLAMRNLTLRPWRTLFLLGGYSLGVAVMIVLLAVGEAMLTQARSERLIGGGQITVLPEGIDVELLKTGGLGGMFFSIDHARFIDRQLLSAPRLAPWVSAVAPQIDGKLLYVRLRNGRELPVRGSGSVPSRDAAVGAAPTLAGGAWTDDALDRRWVAPTAAEVRDEIDHFHLPPVEARGDSTWAEWHYFNVLSADHTRWAFITLMVGGAVPDGRWGGQVLVTLHEAGKPARRFVERVPPQAVAFSTSSADLTIGYSTVRVLPSGDYAVHAMAHGENGGAPIDVQLVVRPTPGAYFPGAALGGEGMTSGYVVPALRADASGRICVGVECTRWDDVQSYHDHNWGVWRGVSWEWGAARLGTMAMLYGRVQPPDSVAASQPLFVYVTDSLGFSGLFRPRVIQYEDGKTITVGGKAVRVPSRAVMFDARGDDTLRVELAIEDAAGTDTRTPMVERGDALAARKIARPYFIQMKGIAHVTGRLHGRALDVSGAGFFETYR